MMTTTTDTCPAALAGTSDGPDSAPHYTAFVGTRLLASGLRPDILTVLRRQAAAPSPASDATVLVFDDSTGRQIDFDLRPDADIAAPSPSPARGPGRPKLGVVAREVTLLPRHWEWLGGQPGGASVALRKLVDDARRSASGRHALRGAQDAAYTFLSAIAGDLPGFEEATRALFAADPAKFNISTTGWPADILAHVHRLAGPALQPLVPDKTNTFTEN